MEQEAGLVLLHGAGLAAFVWDDVVSRLRPRTLPVEFPNRGKGKRANRGLALRDYTTSAAEQVEGWDQGPVVLVAHSIGGCVALELAERLGDRVVAMVGIGAAFPRDGGSFIDCLPFPRKLFMPLLLRLFGTRPPDRAIEQGLCADLPPELSRVVVERFTPESRSLYTDNVRYDSLPPERWYVKLTADRDFPPSAQDAMIDNLEATRVIEVDSAHLPMLSRADVVAGILTDLVDDLRPESS